MNDIVFPKGAITSIEELQGLTQQGITRIYVPRDGIVKTFLLERPDGLNIEWCDVYHQSNHEHLSLINFGHPKPTFAFTNYWMAYAYNLKKQKRSA